MIPDGRRPMRLSTPWCRIRDAGKAERKLHAMTRVQRRNHASAPSDVAAWAMSWHAAGRL